MKKTLKTVQQRAADGVTILSDTALAGCCAGCADGVYGAAMMSTSDADMQAYGAFLGAWRRNYRHIIWLIGGASSSEFGESAAE